MVGKVRAIAKGGAGIVREADHIVFVPGVIVGETVEFSILNRQKSIWQGKLLRVLEASPQRTRPPCHHYPQCGGCNLQHMNYEEQLRCKMEILRGNLKKIAGENFPSGFEITASPPIRYRSKSEFQISDGAVGFFAKGSHRIVTITGCILLPEVVENYFLVHRTRAAGIEKGQLRIVSNGHELTSCLEMSDGRETWLSNERTIRFEIDSYTYRFAPDNFIQANLFQLRPMLALLESVIERESPTTAADLFCGTGFFTLPLAARCHEVLAMENDPRNITALRANLALNKVDNVRVVPADVLRAAIPAIELIVVDPPRGGLSARLIAAIAGSGAITVIYFSCDSATFARDLRLFAGHGFGLEELKLVDNFPQSDHFEIFSVLKKK